MKRFVKIEAEQIVYREATANEVNTGHCSCHEEFVDATIHGQPFLLCPSCDGEFLAMLERERQEQEREERALESEVREGTDEDDDEDDETTEFEAKWGFPDDGDADDDDFPYNEDD